MGLEASNSNHINPGFCLIALQASYPINLDSCEILFNINKLHICANKKFAFMSETVKLSLVCHFN